MKIRCNFTGRIAQAGLMAAGALVGGCLYWWAPYHLIAAVSKISAVFIGTVWVTVMAFALKLADVTEAPGLSPAEHRQLEARARAAVKTVWLYAAGNVLAAVLVLLPSVLAEGRMPIYAAAVVGAGVAAGFAAYSVIAHAIWQEELRRFRSSLRERERTEKAHEALAASIEPGAPSDEVQRQIAAHNRVIDWPAAGSKR